MQVKSITECSKGSFLQFFRPSLIYHFPLRPLFCLLLSGHLRQVLLYIYSQKAHGYIRYTQYEDRLSEYIDIEAYT